jgi:hypothetical protein
MPRPQPSLRQCMLFLAAGLLSAMAPRLSAGQTLLNDDVIWPGLTQDDIDRMHAAAARLYEGRSIGTIERWRSPDSKDAGEIKLLRSFTVRGMPCHALEYTTRFDTERNRPSHTVINWCMVQQGVWKIVELIPPR